MAEEEIFVHKERIANRFIYDIVHPTFFFFYFYFY